MLLTRFCQQCATIPQPAAVSESIGSTQQRSHRTKSTPTASCWLRAAQTLLFGRNTPVCAAGNLMRWPHNAGRLPQLRRCRTQSRLFIVQMSCSLSNRLVSSNPLTLTMLSMMTAVLRMTGFFSLSPFTSSGTRMDRQGDSTACAPLVSVIGSCSCTLRIVEEFPCCRCRRADCQPSLLLHLG